MKAWSYTDNDGYLHAVRWDNGQMVGDPQAVSLIIAAVEQEMAVDESGTKAGLDQDWRAWLTIDQALRYWFDNVRGPDLADVAPSTPNHGVR